MYRLEAMVLTSIADVFAHGKSLEEACTDWVTRFRSHESKAIAEIFNFVLKSAGCDQKVDEHDAEDPDHFPEKLRDIQDEYQAVSRWLRYTRTQLTATAKCVRLSDHCTWQGCNQLPQYDERAI